MLTIFQICFFVGLGLTVLSFILGNLFEFAGIDGLDFDFNIGISIFIPVSPMLFMLFATIFGGVGWILMDAFPAMAAIFIILIAFLAGTFICGIIKRFIIEPLKKAQNTSTPKEEQFIGLRATVTESILTNGFGEIRYVINGNSYTSPARSTNGNEIKVGKDVAICWIKEHVFYVASLEDI